MSRVVQLHIGAPKTGTTYLQDRLGRNADGLAEHGVHFPTRNRFVAPDMFHFQAALDLLGQDWGGPPGHAEGAWDKLVQRVRRLQGTVVVSHEILAAAPAERIAKAMNDLGKDAEVHIVYSVRDLGRQLPAGWQESIKLGRRWTFRRFLTAAQRDRVPMYRAMDLPAVLNRWGAHLPPDRVHVITVPPSGGVVPGDDLWHRFCRVVGIDPAWAPAESERANTSLGVVETQLIRRLNRRMNPQDRTDPAHQALIRGMLAEQQLARRDSPRVRLPADMYDWVEEQTGRWIDWINGSGVDVVGSVDDLHSPRPAADEPWVDPDRVPPRQLLPASMAALEAMTLEAARRPPVEHRVDRIVREGVRRVRRR